MSTIIIIYILIKICIVNIDEIHDKSPQNHSDNDDLPGFIMI